MVQVGAIRSRQKVVSFWRNLGTGNRVINDGYHLLRVRAPKIADFLKKSNNLGQPSIPGLWKASRILDSSSNPKEVESDVRAGYRLLLSRLKQEAFG